MKIVLTLENATVEWDRSLCDDEVELNQIALDIQNGKSHKEILAAYLRRRKDMLDYVCPVCAMKDVEINDDSQGDLFADEGESDAEIGETEETD